MTIYTEKWIYNEHVYIVSSKAKLVQLDLHLKNLFSSLENDIGHFIWHFTLNMISFTLAMMNDNLQ